MESVNDIAEVVASNDAVEEIESAVKTLTSYAQSKENLVAALKADMTTDDSSAVLAAQTDAIMFRQIATWLVELQMRRSADKKILETLSKLKDEADSKKEDNPVEAITAASFQTCLSVYASYVEGLNSGI